MAALSRLRFGAIPSPHGFGADIAGGEWFHWLEMSISRERSAKGEWRYGFQLGEAQDQHPNPAIDAARTRQPGTDLPSGGSMLVN
jgi:hypothetical protein